MEFHKIPNTDKYVIIVTTLMRIYQYIGAVQNPEEKPLLQQIFNKYLNVQGKFYFIKLFYDYNQTNIFTESFNEVINNLPYSKIQFYYPSLGILPKSFGWLTEPGIFYAQVIISLLFTIFSCNF